MKNKPLIAFSFIFLLAFSFSTAFASTFSRNLKQGDRGNDVLELQKALNAVPSGQETTYFGRLTTLAVIKFQKLYNISPAVGFVGPLTRAKLNSLGGNPPPIPVVEVVSISTTTLQYLNVLLAQRPQSTSTVHIASMSPSISGLSGKVTVQGSGFTSDKNLLFTPFGSISELLSSNGTVVEFNMAEIPLLASFRLSKVDLAGLHSFDLPISISNANGISNTAILPLSF